MALSNITDTIRRDSTVAFRRALKQPLAFLAIVLIIATGLGMVTSAVSIAEPFFWRPLPFPESNRLLHLSEVSVESPADPVMVSYPTVRDFQEYTEHFVDLGVYRPGTAVIRVGDASPVRKPATAMSAGVFAALGVRPALGRLFLTSDNTPGAQRTLVISHHFWQSQFGGDTAIIGQHIEVRGQRAEVVGVMPEGFRFPDGETELWTAVVLHPEELTRSRRAFFAISRLSGTSSLQQGRQEWSRHIEGMSEDYPEIYTTYRGAARGLRAALVPSYDGIRSAALLLGLTLGIVLMSVSLTTSLVFAAMATRRTKEFQIRHALGGSLIRLRQQIVIETFYPVLAGALLGYWATALAVATAESTIPSSIFRVGDLSPSLGAFAGGVALILTILVIVANVPTRQIATIRSSIIGETGSRGYTAAWSRAPFLAALCGMATVLVVSGVQLGRSALALTKESAGFDTEGLWKIDLVLPAREFRNPEDTGRFYEKLTVGLGERSNVTGATVVRQLPSTALSSPVSVAFPAESNTPIDQALTDIWDAAPGFEDVIGLRVVEGRGFTWSDRTADGLVAILTQSLAFELFDEVSPIGLTVGLTSRPGFVFEVVGIVNDIRPVDDMTRRHAPTVYLCSCQIAAANTTLLVRTSSDGSVSRTVSDFIESLNPRVSIHGVTPVTHLVSNSYSMAIRRYPALVLAAVGATTLVIVGLAAFGIGTELEHSRRREVSIRRALGASRVEIAGRLGVGMVRAVALGVLSGIVVSILGARVYDTLLYRVQPIDLVALLLASSAVFLLSVVCATPPMIRALTRDLSSGLGT